MPERKIVPIPYQELVRVFEMDGFVLKRQKGDHLIMTKPGVRRPFELLDEV
jgi:predicted RNA binding protein YcfA (HicA-like mRNA interferase family)